MTLTRELRTSIAFMMAVALALTAFVWGNQRLVHATLATEILCLVDQVGDEGDGTTGIFPMFEEDCEDDGGQVIDWCPDLPGNQSQSDLPCTVPPQCNDGIDNDNDGKVDWGVPGDADADPGCSTPTDDNEGDDPTLPAQCADGQDNDGDGKVDMADPGCSSPSDTDETDQGGGNNPACSDGQDNDGDGKTDFPADPGCTDANDTDETDSTGGGGSAQCSDSQDNDGDGLVDFPADLGCSDAQDDNETDEGQGGGGGSNDDDGDSSGGSSHRRSGGSRSSGSQGEVLGAQDECPMYLTGYIKYGAQNDAGEVAKLQVFLNTFEGNTLPVTGTYGPATLAAVNAFQNKYAADILTPWGARGATGYVYYTTQKTINTIYCKFQKDFPLSASQIEEIAYVRQVQPQLRAQGITSMGTTGAGAVAPAAAGAAPAVGSVVAPNVKVDENSSVIDPKVQTATAANATSTGAGEGWLTRFINWLFGR